MKEGEAFPVLTAGAGWLRSRNPKALTITIEVCLFAVNEVSKMRVPGIQVKSSFKQGDHRAMAAK